MPGATAAAPDPSDLPLRPEVIVARVPAAAQSGWFLPLAADEEQVAGEAGHRGTFPALGIVAVLVQRHHTKVSVYILAYNLAGFKSTLFIRVHSSDSSRRRFTRGDRSRRAIETVDKNSAAPLSDCRGAVSRVSVLQSFIGAGR